MEEQVSLIVLFVRPEWKGFSHFFRVFLSTMYHCRGDTRVFVDCIRYEMFPPKADSDLWRMLFAVPFPLAMFKKGG